MKLLLRVFGKLSRLLLLGGGAALLPAAGHAQAVLPADSAARVAAAADSVVYVHAWLFNQEEFRYVAGQVQLELGATRPAYGALATELDRLQYPALPAVAFSAGGSLQLRLRRLVLGATGQRYTAAATAQPRSVQVVGAGLAFFAGYAWLNEAHTHSVYPLLGVGFQDAELRLLDAAPASGTVAGALQGSSYAKTLQYTTTTLLLGAAYDYYPFDEGLLKRNVLGVRATYAARLGQGTYYVNDVEQELAGPALTPMQLSVLVAVGFVF